MARKMLPFLLAVVCIVVFSSLMASHAQAQMPYDGPQDLFRNYYAPPGPGLVGAELYLCPRPVPPLTGHTYITYQPLMPHEFLYKHHRTYVTKHPDAPATRTHVRWR